MNDMLNELISKAKKDESVFIDEISAAFADEKCVLTVILSLPFGEMKQFDIRVPFADMCNPEHFCLLREYIFARLYNAVSVFGGVKCYICVDENNVQGYELVRDINDVFEVSLPKTERKGYGKCINVTDRVNSAAGCSSFSFEICSTVPELKKSELFKTNAIKSFRKAVKTAKSGYYCGIDIGGSDIKLVASCNGHIEAVKEYDWNPSEYTSAEQIISPIVVLLRAMRCVLGCYGSNNEQVIRKVLRLLDKNTPIVSLSSIIDELESAVPPIKFNGVGISFPDVVICNEIVGGETPKTKGIRETAQDYEYEFGKFRNLHRLINDYCEDDACISIANDGSIAAYTAAIEWAWSDETEERVTNGVFAHSLGTELGTGWIDQSGCIPKIPLEVYNCIIDLGSYRSREYCSADVRSTLSINTGLAGTLQKYAGQYGAYRMAVKMLEDEAPEEYKKLFDLGFLIENESVITVRIQPEDMRKPLLEYLMQKAANGESEYAEVFRRIGEYLAVIWKETDSMLETAVKSRVLFGRFVKKKKCFELMCEGAARKYPIEFYAADESLANTPLMCELSKDQTHTVAQFGQAVGAIYYSASEA